MKVLLAKEDLIDQLVLSHIEVFKDNFMSKMGKDFLRYFYSTAISSEFASVYCLVERSQLLAWTVVYSEPNKFLREYRSSVSLFKITLVSILKNLSLIKLFVSALFKAFGKSGFEFSKSGYVEISIVAAKVPGKGYGSLVLNEVMNKSSLSQKLNYLLEVDKENAIAIKSYKKLGFKINCEFKRGRREMYLMEK